MGSSTSFRLAWTTRSAMVGIPSLRSFPEFAFRYHHLPHFDRPELTRLQRIPDLAQESPDPDPGLDLGRGGPIDARGPGALVGGHAFPRGHQERRVVDEVEQVTEPATRIFGRPAVQLGLHPPYRDARPNQSGQATAPVFTGASSDITFPSLTDTLPPFPMCAAFPRSEYYGGSAPSAPSAGVAPIRRLSPWTGSGTERTRMVPTFTAVRSTG